MPRPKQVTLAHIAKRLGLTVHTVSKALRGLPGMSEATRREVFALAREMGYHTKAQEAGLTAESIAHAAGKPRRFVVLMAGDYRFYQLQFNGLHLRMHELGHAVQSLIIPNAVKDEKTLHEWLERTGVIHCDGLFLSPLSRQWEQLLLKLPLPKVMINYPPDAAEVDSVVWDVQHAVHQSVDALCRLGHRNILYVGDIRAQRGFKLRWQAYLAALGRHGLEASPEDQLLEFGRGREEWLERLSDRIRSGRFSAVVSVIPGYAEWVFIAARQAGRAIPEQLSLVGLEHEELEPYPQLSRPVLLVQEAGERAAELMLRRIANPLAPHEHVRLQGTFLTGETIARV